MARSQAGAEAREVSVTAFLLDTNVFSELGKPRPAASVMKRIEQYASRIVTASVVVHEITFGLARLAPSRRRDLAERFVVEVLDGVPVLAYDEAAARWHAVERARLAARGRTVPQFDGQIAAIAAVHGATLVTRNVKDFSAFEGLDVASWHPR